MKQYNSGNYGFKCRNNEYYIQSNYLDVQVDKLIVKKMSN